MTRWLGFMVIPGVLVNCFRLAHLFITSLGGTHDDNLDHLTCNTSGIRNIRVGKPMVVKGLHAGGVSQFVHVGGVPRFANRTFVQYLGGRKTTTPYSFVRVDNGQHEGRNYFAPGCKLNPPLPDYCRIV